MTKLREQLKQGSTSLVGNNGYRKYLSARGESAFQIDESKVEADARFDGIAILLVNPRYYL